MVIGPGAAPDGGLSRARHGRPRGHRVAPYLQGPASRGGRGAWRVAGRVLGAGLSLSLLLGSGYAWMNYRNLNAGLQRLGLTTGRSPVSATGGGARHDLDGPAQNILVAGNDDRTDMTDAEVRALDTGRDGGSLNTDTMMIIHIPAGAAKATLISLPRDAYVSIPGYGWNKLNAAYAFGYRHASGSTNTERAAGANLLIQTVQNLTGLTLDHFVQIDMVGFYRIALAVGGVPVNLCHAVNDTVAHNRAIGVGGGSGLVMAAGHHVLNAVQALAFVRQRHGLPGGDLDRTARQRYFLTAAFRQIASAGTLLNPSKLSALISAVDHSLYVDAGFDVPTLVRQMINLNANNITGKLLPFDHFWNSSPVGSVEMLNLAQIRQFIAQIIEPTPAVPNRLVAPSAVTVSVLNSGAVSGAAATNAALLRRIGFHATSGNGTTPTTLTTIEYPPGMQRQAATVARYLPGATVRAGQITTVTVLLGNDGLHVTTPQTKSTAASPPATPPTHKPIDAGCIN